MFRSRSRRPVRIPTLIARITLTASVAIFVGAGIANAQPTQPQQGQPTQVAQQQPVVSPQQQSTQPQPQIPQSQPLSQPLQGNVSGNTVTTQTTVTAAPTIVTSVNTADPRTSQILGVPESHCGHVIDLLIRSRMRQQSGSVGAELAP